MGSTIRVVLSDKSFSLHQPEADNPSPDFDGDGEVGFSDFILFAQAFGGTDARFDLNSDGLVEFQDFILFASAFGESTG